MSLLMMSSRSRFTPLHVAELRRAMTFAACGAALVAAMTIGGQVQSGGAATARLLGRGAVTLR